MKFFNSPESLAERLTDEARMLREEAELLPPGVLRDAVIRKAGLTYTAAHLNESANSAGLQPPK
jgi:hypothetical protein